MRREIFVQCRNYAQVDLLPFSTVNRLTPISSFLFTRRVGMASPLFGVAAVNALLFAAYSNFKKLQEPYPGGPLTLNQIAIAGAGAGTTVGDRSLPGYATLHVLSRPIAHSCI